MIKKQELVLKPQDQDIKILSQKISHYIDSARQSIHKSIDIEMVNAYFRIGREIVEEEQKGHERAEYGKMLLQDLSEVLTKKYGKGFGISTLRDIRQFYIVYTSQIHHAVRGESSTVMEDIREICLEAIIGALALANYICENRRNQKPWIYKGFRGIRFVTLKTPLLLQSS